MKLPLKISERKTEPLTVMMLENLIMMMQVWRS
jgi:hypothetical protein